jgi:hypothetical protein
LISRVPIPFFLLGVVAALFGYILTQPPQDIRTTSNVFLTVPDVTALNWGSNIVLTVTNTGTMQIDFPPDISRGDNP